MGTANKQIATRVNVNAKRLGAFVTSTSGGTYMKKCATKKAVRDIEYLEVTNRKNTSKILFYTNDYGFFYENQNIMTISSYSGTDSKYINAENVYIYRNTYNQYSVAYVNMNFHAYPSSLCTVTLSSNWPSSGSTDKYENVALFSQRFTGVPTNQIITINYSGFVDGNTCSMSFSDGNDDAISVPPISGNMTMGIVVTDDTGYVIASKSPTSYDYNDVDDSFSFSSTSSTINIYFIAPILQVVFYPRSEEGYTGLQFTLAVEMNYYESYYDQTYKCVQYQDIAATGGTFSCSYYIYNNKSSNAKLDWVKCYVGATSDPTKGTWTEVGSTTQGTVDGHASGTVLCTIPSSKISSTQQWFHARCGYTTLNQQWYGGWGSGGVNNNASKYCGKQTWGYTPAVPLTSPTGASAVLNHNLIRSAEAASMGYIVKGIYGQTTTRHALFRIE